jgi:CheY-like chemotaxis protein
VDDEPAVLAGLGRNLRRSFDVETAVGGAEALHLIETREPFAVIVSDMIMPGMNGAEFLHLARQRTPDSVRVLLTGQADVTLAAAAVNDGAIARYLSKPCSTEDLIRTLTECSAIHQRAAIERDVLERTLTASIAALSQTLALAAPAVFARSARAQQIMKVMLPELEPSERWSAEVAVPLSQLGAVALSDLPLDQWSAGAALSEFNRAIVVRMRSVSLAIVGSIPRLELTGHVIRDGFVSDPPAPEACAAAAMLWCSFELDAMETKGVTRAEGAAMLAKSLDPSHRHILNPLLTDDAPRAIERISLLGLTDGMVLAQDVTSDGGVLLVGRGSVVTPALVARLQAFRSDGSIDFVHIFGGAT